MPETDLLHRFTFQRTDIRGEIVQLSDSYHSLIAAHDYPPLVARQLGEFMVASVLLSSIIKFQGKLVLQIRSEGQIPLLMVEATHERKVRGIARYQGENIRGSFADLFKQGTLVVTMDPDQGERYQSLVPMNGVDLAACIEHYFAQSEQLATRLHLVCDGQTAAGFLLQQLPAQLQPAPDQRRNQWEHVTILGASLRDDELLTLSVPTILGRLFVEEDVQMMLTEPVRFVCSCNRQRTASALLTLGADEVAGLFETSDTVELHCEFCNTRYSFDIQSLTEIGRGDQPTH